MAKSETAMQHLARQFFEHTVYRRYQALVWGELEEETGTITGNIARHARFRKLLMCMMILPLVNMRLPIIVCWRTWAMLHWLNVA